MALSGRDKRHLRGEAHSLKPIVRVGREGLTSAVAAEIEGALDHHELIKVHLSGDREERAAVAAAMSGDLGCEQIASIGRVVVLYRQQPDPERRRYRVATSR